MTGKELVARVDYLQEVFDNTVIATEDVKIFLTYFGAILQISMNEGVIDQERRDSIAKAITYAIEQITQDDDEEEDENYVQIRNYMYIISCYLQAKSNWKAWMELSSIKSVKDAKDFISAAEKWVKDRLGARIMELNSIKQKVLKLGMDNVTESYKYLESVVHEFITCTTYDTKFDLQNYHNVAFAVGTYVLMNDELESGENFYNIICNTVHNFCMEVSIMDQTNIKGIVSEKNNEAEEFYTTQYNESEALNSKYEAMLKELKEERNNQLQEYYDFHGKKGQKVIDDVEIESRYLRKREKIENEWDKECRKLEKRQAKAESLQIELLGGDYSLGDLIKEYAIFSFAKKALIHYPETVLERAAMISAFELKRAIPEFISINNEVLSDEQKKFLMDIVNSSN